MKRFLFSALLIVFVLFLFRVLFLPQIKIKSDGFSGETLPAFTLPTLNPPGNYIDAGQFKGHFSLIVIFAAWCAPCQAEQATLLTIQKQNKIPIYGIDYKDTPQEALQFIKKYGNPFKSIGLDIRGQTVIDLGATGTPETFVVNQQGKIIYRHPGVLTLDDWETQILPIIEKNS